MFNNNDKEDDIFKFKSVKDYNPIKYGHIQEFKSFLVTPSDNYTSYFNNNLSDFYNDENSYNKKEKKKIFKIEKINKKIGRIKKNSILKGIHNRLSEDNIIRKIKGRFIEKIRLYINIEYQKFILVTKKKKGKVNWLKKINPKIYRKIKKEDNLKWFDTKIYEIFSENLSERYSSFLPDSNKKKINRLILLNEAKNIIKILNTKVELLFNSYINEEQIEGFKTLNDDIKELEYHMEKNKQENIKEYLRRNENIAKNMKKIFIQKISRNYHEYSIKNEKLSFISSLIIFNKLISLFNIILLCFNIIDNQIANLIYLYLIDK